MELHHLKLFNTVAMLQSFTKASEKLHLSQPALSMQIKKLEEEIGLRLFDKIGNKIILNSNGSTLFSYTSKIFDLVSQAEHELMNIKGYIGGTLNIGGSNTSGTYILPKIIGEFKKVYPDVKVNLHISNTDEIANMVENGTVDFAVNGGNMGYSSNINVKELMRDKLVIAVSPQSRLAAKNKVQIEDFNNTEYIVHETNSQLYKQVYNFIEENKITGATSTSLGNIGAIKQAVAANLGISIIPYSAVALELKLGLIIELNFSKRALTYPYSLIHNKNRYLSPAAKMLISFIETSMKEHS